MYQDPIAIVGGKRTPMGGFRGDLSYVTAPELGSFAIRAALIQSGVLPEAVDEVIMGVVLPAAMGQAPARQASFGAGIPSDKSSTTINKMCGSGMKAAMFAYDALMARSCNVMIAGGMESMSNAPYIMPKARNGFRMGHNKIYDHMFIDGLEDAYDKGKLMGSFAEDTANHYQFTRESQDDFAIESLSRAKEAIENGSFDGEVEPVNFCNSDGKVTVSKDEQPLKANLEKIRKLRPAFSKEGTVTAANSSSISDGGAALVMMRLSEAEKRGHKPLVIVKGHSTHSQAPELFTTAPINAIKKLLERVQWSKGEVDLFEINEAFAVVTMAAMRDLDIPHDIVNVHGGACALGHPVGASGARIIVTLIATLEKYNLRKGVASLCIGGGEATAIAIERVT